MTKNEDNLEKKNQNKLYIITSNTNFRANTSKSQGYITKFLYTVISYFYNNTKHSSCVKISYWY